MAGLAILVLHAAALAWSAARHAPMLDETAHLAAGLSHWRFGTFELYRVNPPLPRAVAAVPLLFVADVREDWSARQPGALVRNEFKVGDAFIAANGQRSFQLFAMARWACIPFSLVGALVCWRWAQQKYGSRAGLAALILWCGSPAVLTFGVSVFPDLAAAAGLLCAAYTLDRWLRQPSPARAATCGAALGLALLTKTTLIVCVPLWCLLMASHRNARAAPGRLAISLLLVVAISLTFLNAGYLFRGTLQPLGAYAFRSRAFSGLAGAADAVTRANRFADGPLAWLPLPLPQDYVMGIDLQWYDFENPAASYLLGEWRRPGWWYYYMYGFMVKEPAGVLLLLLMSAAIRLDQHSGGIPRQSERALWAPIVALYLLVSSSTGFTHHLRYVLPAHGLLAVWISRLASRPLLATERPTALLACGGLTWSVVSVACCFPHTMSYFNELAGGPAYGHRHLLFTSMDYGQDLLFLRDWAQAHPEYPFDGICCFQTLDPKYAGFNAGLPPSWPPADGLQFNSAPASGPVPGIYAISAYYLCGGSGTILQNGRMEQVAGQAYQYFNELEPIDRAGYSIWIFRVRRADVIRLRDRAGLPIEDAGH